LIEKIKQHMKDIVNISIQYVNYSFVSNYQNCLLLCIKKGNLNKDLLLFMTEDGSLSSVDLEDEFVKVSVKSICQN
tara:strand:- start:488 stop:715 length:228 start_codon:yes stop_codon:yes gene_type:complete